MQRQGHKHPALGRAAAGRREVPTLRLPSGRCRGGDTPPQGPPPLFFPAWCPNSLRAPPHVRDDIFPRVSVFPSRQEARDRDSLCGSLWLQQCLAQGKAVQDGFKDLPNDADPDSEGGTDTCIPYMCSLLQSLSTRRAEILCVSPYRPTIWHFAGVQ